MTLFQKWLQYILKKNNIIQELSWYFFGQVVVQISSFVSAIIVSRYLGPTNLGLLSFSQNFISVFLAVVAGIDFYSTWVIARSDSVIKDMQDLFVYKSIVHGGLAVLGVASAYFFLPKDIAFLCVIMFLSSVLQSFSLFTTYALRYRYAKKVGVIQTSLAVIFLVGKVIGAWLTLPISYFAFLAGVDSVAFGLVMSVIMVVYTKELKTFFSSLEWIGWKKVRFFSFAIMPNVGALFLWNLILRADQFLVAFFTNAHTTGLYAAAVKIAEMPNTIAGVLSSAFMSRIALLPEMRGVKYRNYFLTLISTSFLCGVIVTAGIVLFGKQIILFLYGETFAESGIMLSLYAFTIPFMFINYILHGMYGAFFFNRLQVVVYATAVALNVFMSSIFFLYYGVIGIIIGTILAYMCATVMGVYFFLSRNRE